MNTSYDVKFWDIRRNQSSRTASFEVRWKVGRRGKSKGGSPRSVDTGCHAASSTLAVLCCS